MRTGMRRSHIVLDQKPPWECQETNCEAGEFYHSRAGVWRFANVELTLIKLAFARSLFHNA
jgi:hypothetical protein